MAARGRSGRPCNSPACAALRSVRRLFLTNMALQFATGWRAAKNGPSAPRQQLRRGKKNGRLIGGLGLTLQVDRGERHDEYSKRKMARTFGGGGCADRGNATTCTDGRHRGDRG